MKHHQFVNIGKWYNKIGPHQKRTTISSVTKLYLQIKLVPMLHTDLCFLHINFTQSSNCTRELNPTNRIKHSNSSQNARFTRPSFHSFLRKSVPGIPIDKA